MKIRRFVAVDMKTALAQIKEELGADAVIMSNKKIAGGVEIMAAIDYYPSQTQPESTPEQSTGAATDLNNDVVNLSSQAKAHTAQATSNKNNEQPVPDSLSALLNRKVQQEPKIEPVNVPSVQDKSINEASITSAVDEGAININDSSTSDIELQFKNFTDRLQQTTQQRNVEQEQQQAASVQSLHNDGAAQQQSSAQTIIHSQANMEANDHSVEFDNMKKEMHTIRHLLEHQLSGLMWQDMAQKNPQKALLINKLVALGLTDHMADQIAGFIPPQQNDQDAWEQAKKFITQQLNTTNNDIIHHGGVISLVGPTGVGKTTTIAKLAARFAQIHGADEVVLISTDSFRIGGFEQLTTYGRIIGCQVKLANDAQALDSLLQQFSHKKLVLIDTAGMGQRDMRLAQHLTDLIANARVRIRNYLVLSANTQQRVMQENVELFKKS